MTDWPVGLLIVGSLLFLVGCGTLVVSTVAYYCGVNTFSASGVLCGGGFLLGLVGYLNNEIPKKRR